MIIYGSLHIRSCDIDFVALKFVPQKTEKKTRKTGVSQWRLGWCVRSRVGPGILCEQGRGRGRGFQGSQKGRSVNIKIFKLTSKKKNLWGGFGSRNSSEGGSGSSKFRPVEIFQTDKIKPRGGGGVIPLNPPPSRSTTVEANTCLCVMPGSFRN